MPRVIPKVLDGLRTAKRVWRSRRLRGDAVHCPCCGGSFARFLDYGEGRRPNVMCPRCGAVERHRLLWLFLERRTELFTRPHRLLQIAPQPAFLERFLRHPGIDYVFGDLVPSRYLVGKGARVLDVTALDLPDASFDALLCNHVLEHVPDDATAMRELRRVLKPGAWAILQVPLDTSRATTYEDWSIVTPQDRAAAFGQSDHVRWYGRDYADRLRAAGFDVEVVPFGEELDAATRERLRLGDGEDVYFCRRPAADAPR